MGRPGQETVSETPLALSEAGKSDNSAIAAVRASTYGPNSIQAQADKKAFLDSPATQISLDPLWQEKTFDGKQERFYIAMKPHAFRRRQNLAAMYNDYLDHSQTSEQGQQQQQEQKCSRRFNGNTVLVGELGREKPIRLDRSGSDYQFSFSVPTENRQTLGIGQKILTRLGDPAETVEKTYLHSVKGWSTSVFRHGQLLERRDVTTLAKADEVNPALLKNVTTYSDGRASREQYFTVRPDVFGGDYFCLLSRLEAEKLKGKLVRRQLVQ